MDGTASASSHGESTGEDSDEDWVSWFCFSLAGNKFFCDVERSYIEDTFNLFGLKQYVPKNFSKALDMILDKLEPSEQTEDLSKSAAMLYGLIHARYIITPRGLDCMQRKYLNGDFGECPRTMCRGQAVLPMGAEDEPRVGMVKLFCPRCRDVFNCHANQRHIDGAFFGPTFPNMFLMNFEELVPEHGPDLYVPRVFGFKIHNARATSGRKGTAEADVSSTKGDFQRRVFIGDSRGDTVRYLDAGLDAGAGAGSRVKEILSRDSSAEAAGAPRESEERAVNRVGGKRASSLSDEDRAQLGDANATKRSRVAQHGAH